jgi:hypothetical protein
MAALLVCPYSCLFLSRCSTFPAYITTFSLHAPMPPGLLLDGAAQVEETLLREPCEVSAGMRRHTFLFSLARNIVSERFGSSTIIDPSTRIWWPCLVSSNEPSFRICRETRKAIFRWGRAYERKGHISACDVLSSRGKIRMIYWWKLYCFLRWFESLSDLKRRPVLHESFSLRIRYTFSWWWRQT